MAILEGDIKLLKSQVMDDVDEGGGRSTGVAIVDGASNSIFADVSELDRTYGRVSLRKVFVQVDTPDTEGYFGANVIIADPPDDPRVSCTLFTTKDGFDERTAAQSRVESYLAQGSIYYGILFGDHIAGQMTVSVLQREGYDLPSNGDTFVLRKREGFIDVFDQYVRVTNVSSRVRTFTDTGGDFKRVEVTIDISDALQDDFPGFEATRYDTAINYTGRTKFYSTIVADAARYYGALPLEVAAEVGDVVVKAPTIFTQIVPSTRIEIPIADARMNQQAAALVASGTAFSDVINAVFTSSNALFIGGGILPGTLSVVRGGVTMTDKGGALEVSGQQVGSIDYANGILTLTTNPFGTTGGNHTVSYTPASTPNVVTSSIGIPVTQQNQRLSWNLTIDPVPAKASLQISYRTLGRWYVLTEDGSGSIKGSDSGFGAGRLNYQTGSVAITLGALPDVDSSIVLVWAPSVVARPIAAVPAVGESALASFAYVAQFNFSFSDDAVFTWTYNGAKSATMSGRTITGDATGSCDYDTGIVRFSPNVLPPKGTVVTLNSTRAVPSTTYILLMSDTGTTWTGIPSPTAVVRPHSLQINFAGQLPVRAFPGIDKNVYRWIRAFDDGNGKLVLANGTSNLEIGTIDYANGSFTVLKSIAGYKDEQPTFETKEVFVASGGGAGGLNTGSNVQQTTQTGFETRTVNLSILNTGNIYTPLPAWAWWTGATAAAQLSFTASVSSSQSSTFTLNDLFIQGAPERFKLGNDLYLFRGPSVSGVSNGYELNPYSGAATTLASGVKTVLLGNSGVNISQWTAGVSSTPSSVTGVGALSLTGEDTLMVTEGVTFRTAISPLFNGGFTVSGTFSDGTTFTATPDAQGVIKTATSLVKGVVGKVNYDAGVATLKFGTLGGTTGAVGVQDLTYLGIAGVTNVVSAGVQADTLRYSAVGYSYIPLDAEILGLNPVRLPSDGRVPIFRKGGVVVVHHTALTSAQTVGNGQTIDLSRTRLSKVRVVGANGATIQTGYTTNLDAGTVTFTNVTGYSQPVRIEHRIEDMALIQDVQINGSLSLTRQLTHDFPLGSYLSSALIIGDMKARVSTLFDQSTFNNALWDDSPVGSPATGTFNDVTAPIEVTNGGAITERWAVVFTNTTAFNIIGEHVGVIATGSTATNTAPNNPSTGTPYFTIPALGWGAGWAVGNVLRFNTIGAQFPIWAIRTIQQGPATAQDDAFTLLIRGDIDRP